MAGKLDPKNLNRVQKQLEQINKYAKQLGQSLDGIDLRPLENNIKNIDKLFKSLHQKINDTTNGLSQMAQGFEYVGKSTSDTVSSTDDISKKITSNKKGLAALNEEWKDVNKNGNYFTKSLKKSYIAFKGIASAATGVQGPLGDMAKLIEKGVKGVKQIPKGFERAKSRLAAFNKLKEMKLKKEGDLTKMISKERGNLSDAQIKAGFGGKKLKNALGQRDAIRGSLKSMKGLRGVMSKVAIGAKGFAAGIAGAAGPIGLIVMLVTKLIEGWMQFDKTAGSLAKNLNVSYQEAKGIEMEMMKIADNSMEMTLNSQDLAQTLSETNSILGTSVMLTAEELKYMTDLRTHAGLTTKDMESMFLFTKATGGDLEKNVNSFRAAAFHQNAAKNVAIDSKKLMKDMGKLSKNALMNFAGSTKELAKAMVTIKAMGIEMGKLESIQSGLLDFESSIQNELEAELMTGRSINLEKARLAALNEDMVGLAEALNEQNITAAEYTEMNAFQRAAMAKSLGMEKEELAAMLYEQEALASVGGKMNDLQRKAYDQVVKEKGVKEANRMLAEGELGSLEKQISEQEKLALGQKKFQDAMIKLGSKLAPLIEAFVKILDVIMPIVNIIAEVLVPVITVIGERIKSRIMQPFMALKDLFGGIIKIFKGDFLGGLKDIGKAIVRYLIMPWQIMSDTAFAILNALITAVNKIPGVNFETFTPPDYTNMLFGDDVVSKAGYGKRTLLMDEGAIQLNDKDTIIAGTNLYGNDTISEPGKKAQMANAGDLKIKSPTPSVDMSSTNAKLDAILAAINKGSIIEMDGAKLGETINQGTRAIQ